MNKIVVALAFACALMAALIAAPASASDQTDVMASIQKFVTDFNKGDKQATVAACTDDAVVLDNFPPHEWHGTGACAKWYDDLDANLKESGITYGKVTINKPRHLVVTGDHAYVVAGTAFKFRLKGKPTTQPGQFTIAMVKTGGAWRIAGWAWADQ